MKRGFNCLCEHGQMAAIPETESTKPSTLELLASRGQDQSIKTQLIECIMLSINISSANILSLLTLLLDKC